MAGKAGTASGLARVGLGVFGGDRLGLVGLGRQDFGFQAELANSQSRQGVDCVGGLGGPRRLVPVGGIDLAGRVGHHEAVRRGFHLELNELAAANVDDRLEDDHHPFAAHLPPVAGLLGIGRRIHEIG